MKPITCENCHSQHKGVFCELEDRSLSKMSEQKTLHEFKKGQTLFIQGDSPLGLYCVNSGKIKVYKLGPEGKESIIRIAGPGDIVGHRSLLSQGPYLASASALEDARACFIPKEFMFTFIKEEPTLALKLIQKLSLEMGAAEAKSASMFQKTVKQRLAELLLTLSTSFGIQEGPKRRLEIKLTREEMASMIGTSVETVIRFMSELKQEELVSQEGKTIFVLDEPRLLEVADLEA